MAKKRAKSDDDTLSLLPAEDVPPPAAAPVPSSAPASRRTGGYTVLARRYRPQQFKDMVGQDSVSQALINAIQTNRVAHAYLFTGTRGVGKTTTARILAKCLNCVTGPTATPCDKCEACQAIAVGEDVDVVEIDGASNRGIDDIREFRANVQYRPQRSRFKIYIIDEVHQLTKEAFNALLKTLEEPPPHVKFIFATTDYQRIPVTILSRCQRFDLSGIPAKRIFEQLKRIVGDEGIAAEDAALELLARRAAGSMRDAQSLLDQMLAFGGGQLTAKQVHDLLGTANEDRIVELASAILSKNAGQALGLLHRCVEEGVQFGELLDQLLDYWRDLLLLASAGPEVEGLNFPPRFRDAMQQQAKSLTVDTILAGMDILAAAKFRLRGTTHGRVLVEMAFVRLAGLENLAPLSQIVQMLADGTATASPRSPAAALPRTQVASGDVKKNSLTSAPPPSPPSAAPPEEIVPIPLSDSTLQQVWPKALTSIGMIHRSELEKAGDLAISAPNCLVLRFHLSYNNAKSYCQDSARNERLEESLRKVTGQRIAVRYETSADGAAANSAAPEPRVPKQAQARSAATQEALVKCALEKLGGSLVKVDDGFGQAAVPASAGDNLSDIPEPQEAGQDV